MLESNKKELQFSLNLFDAPLETSGITAWVRLITQLLFLIPGTYPSDPNIGIGIQNYDFMLYQDVKDDLEDKISEQIKTYLPDIPFDSVTTKMSDQYQNVLIIILAFTYDDKSEIAVVASETSKSGINFTVTI